MSRELERVTIFKHLQTLWTPQDGPLAIPNQPFETPKKSRFAAAYIIETGTFRRSLGFNQFVKRHNGTLQIDFYTPEGQGTQQSRLLADRLEPVYQDLMLGSDPLDKIYFQTPTARALPLNEQRAANLDDNWDRYIFEAPFYRDEFVMR